MTTSHAEGNPDGGNRLDLSYKLLTFGVAGLIAAAVAFVAVNVLVEHFTTAYYVLMAAAAATALASGTAVAAGERLRPPMSQAALIAQLERLLDELRGAGADPVAVTQIQLMLTGLRIDPCHPALTVQARRILALESPTRDQAITRLAPPAGRR